MMIAWFFVSALIFMALGWFTLRKRYARPTASKPTKMQSLQRVLAFTIGVPLISVLLAFLIFRPQGTPSSSLKTIAPKSESHAVHHDVYYLPTVHFQITIRKTTADEVNDAIGYAAQKYASTVVPDAEMPGSLLTMMPYDLGNEIVTLRFQRLLDSGPYVVTDIVTFAN